MLAYGSFPDFQDDSFGLAKVACFFIVSARQMSKSFKLIFKRTFVEGKTNQNDQFVLMLFSFDVDYGIIS